MVVITKDFENIMDNMKLNIESVMEEADDRNTEYQVHYLHQASRLLEDAQNDTTLTCAQADRALSNVLEFVVNEFGIETEEPHESDLEDYSRKKVNLQNAEDEMACGQLMRLKSRIFVCDHSCCSHKGAMHRDIWSFMPLDLLHLLFTRLPADEIMRLGTLNKEWMETISDRDSEFYRHCDAVQPKMMCILTKDSLTSNELCVRACDLQRGTWSNYKLFVGYPEYLNWTLACEAEGLVCFMTNPNEDPDENLSRWNREDGGLTIFLNVVNPLKSAFRELPPLAGVQPSMFQMKVDTTTKEFHVFVVGKRLDWKGQIWFESNGGYTVKIFDSLTNEWSQWTPAQQLPYIVSGVCGRYGRSFNLYDCANRQLVDLVASESSPWKGAFVAWGSYQNCVFVLRKGKEGPPYFNADANGDEVKFYIEEWQYCEAPENRHSWSKKDFHGCWPSEQPPMIYWHYVMRLFATKGLLMVVGELRIFHPVRDAWLYDLSTRKWSKLHLRLLPEYPYDTIHMICEPHWTS